MTICYNILMKTCNLCQIEKDESEFHRRKTSGTQYRCKECVRIKNAEYTAAKGPELQRKKRVRWAWLRLEAIMHLGGVCAAPGCGWRDPRALQFDHIEGGGHQERLKEGSANNYKIAQRILAGDTRYQLLCANHNWVKRFENKEFGGRRPMFDELIEVAQWDDPRNVLYRLFEYEDEVYSR